MTYFGNYPAHVATFGYPDEDTEEDQFDRWAENWHETRDDKAIEASIFDSYPREEIDEMDAIEYAAAFENHADWLCERAWTAQKDYSATLHVD